MSDVDEIHCIPIPRGYGVENAWAEIVVFGKFPRFNRWHPRFWRMRWVNIRVPAGADPLTEFEVL